MYELYSHLNNMYMAARLGFYYDVIKINKTFSKQLNEFQIINKPLSKLFNKTRNNILYTVMVADSYNEDIPDFTDILKEVSSKSISQLRILKKLTELEDIKGEINEFISQKPPKKLEQLIDYRND